MGRRKGAFSPIGKGTHQNSKRVPTSTANAPAELVAATLRGKEAQNKPQVVYVHPYRKKEKARPMENGAPLIEGKHRPSETLKERITDYE